MTVLLGLVHEGVAHLISDSYLGDAEHPYVADLIGDPKIRKIGRRTLLGFYGDADTVPLYTELIQTALEGERHTHTWIRDKFPLVCQKLTKQADVTLPLSDTGFLLAKPGRLYALSDTLTAYTVLENVPVALGCGKDQAQAALHALLRAGKCKDIAKAMRIAMETTADICPFVSAPFHYFTL